MCSAKCQLDRNAFPIATAGLMGLIPMISRYFSPSFKRKKIQITISHKRSDGSIKILQCYTLTSVISLLARVIYKSGYGNL